MTIETLTELQARVGLGTANGSDVIYTSAGPITIDQLAVLMTGQTVVQGRQEAFRGVTVTGDEGAGALLLGPGVVSWYTSKRDTDSMWSGANPTRIYVPADATKVRFYGKFHTMTSQTITLDILKNGEAQPSDEGHQLGPFANFNGGIPILTDVIDVTGTEYFELYSDIPQGTSVKIPETWLTMEIVEQIQP